MSDLSCDICGRQPIRAQILVEGAKMLACGSCMGSGKVLFRFDDETPVPESAYSSAHVPSTPAFDREGEEIIEDAGRQIHMAREKRKISTSELGKRINESEGTIIGVEHGRFMPSIPLAKKLEKALGIKLIERNGPEVTANSGQKKFGDITLADMIEK